MKALKITGMVVAGIGFFALTVFLVSWILSLLWNWLMPELFNLPEINLLQAAGIFILSKMIFTPGFGRGHESKRSRKSRDWGDKFRQKFGRPESHSHETHFEDVNPDDKS
jgi:hypothetical protein